MTRSRRRSGVVLLEALVALAILATAGLALATVSRESLSAVERARTADREATSESMFLDAVALWSGADLDRRLGSHRQGAWILHLVRPTPQLYDVVLLDSTGTRTLFATRLYRPAPADAQP